MQVSFNGSNFSGRLENFTQLRQQEPNNSDLSRRVSIDSRSWNFSTLNECFASRILTTSPVLTPINSIEDTRRLWTRIICMHDSIKRHLSGDAEYMRGRRERAYAYLSRYAEHLTEYLLNNVFLSIDNPENYQGAQNMYNGWIRVRNRLGE